MEYAWYELDGKVKDLAGSHKVAEPTVPIASDEADLTQDEDMVAVLVDCD